MIPSTFRHRTSYLFALVLGTLMIILYYDLITVRQFPSKNGAREQLREYPNELNEFLRRHLRVDRTNRSSAEIMNDIQEANPHLPVLFWNDTKNQPMYFRNKSCARFPDIGALKINNRLWQMLETKNGTFYMFGAYYDVRKRNPVSPSIRVLAMIDRVKPNVRTYCQVWFADSHEPLITETADYRLIWLWRHNENAYYPHLVTCPLRSTAGRVPVFVSIVESVCDTASNSLPVIYNQDGRQTAKEGFAVCVKNLDVLRQDLSVRLVEWIELVKILGARKIFIYTLHLHENTTKVLEYYKRRGEVEVTPITLAGNQPNVADFHRLHPRASHFGLQQLLNELISLNDCFYKNMYAYDYIAMLDTDEVIVPMKEDNWADLMTTVVKKASTQSGHVRSYFSAKNVLFVPDDDNSGSRYANIPSYMYMLQHVLREKDHLTRGPKTFFDTEIVETVHNHWPVSCLNCSCSGHKIATEDAQSQHYRHKLYLDIGKRTYGSSRVNDTIIWKYKDELIARSLAVLYDLKFFS